MRSKSTTFSIGLIAALAAPCTHAATFSLIPSIVSSLADDGTFTTVIPIDTVSPNGVSRIFQVDFNVTTSNLQPGEFGFGKVQFDLYLLGGITDVGGGWGPNTSTVDSNGASPGGIVPLFNTNFDAGTPGDLKAIQTAIAPGVTNVAVDPRANVGKTNPALIGSIFIRWDASSLFWLVADRITFFPNSTAGTLLGLQGVPDIVFGSLNDPPPYPEPAVKSWPPSGTKATSIPPAERTPATWPSCRPMPSPSSRPLRRRRRRR